MKLATRSPSKRRIAAVLSSISGSRSGSPLTEHAKTSFGSARNRYRAALMQ
jgi:hypothetical protein